MTKFERKSVESFSRCCLVRELGATARRLFYHFLLEGGHYLNGWRTLVARSWMSSSSPAWAWLHSLAWGGAAGMTPSGSWNVHWTRDFYFIFYMISVDGPRWPWCDAVSNFPPLFGVGRSLSSNRRWCSVRIGCQPTGVDVRDVVIFSHWAE